MAKMRIAMFASHFGAAHEKASVFFFHNIFRFKRFGETWPASPGIKFVKGTE
jgi:hypothetical protein